MARRGAGHLRLRARWGSVSGAPGENIAAARSRQNERLTAMEGRRRGVLDARQEAAARRAARRAHLGRIAVPIMCNLHCLQ